MGSVRDDYERGLRLYNAGDLSPKGKRIVLKGMELAKMRADPASTVRCDRRSCGYQR